MEDMMNESEYGPRTRRRAALAIAALLGFVLALLPIAPASAVPAPGVTVTSPTFEDDFSVGTSMTITWVTNATGNATVALYDDAGTPAFIRNLTTTASAKGGKFMWAIPVNEPVGAYNIKVSVTGAFDMSDDGFHLVLPSMLVTSPKATDNWTTGTDKLVKWTSKVSGNVDIDLLDGSGGYVADVKHTVASSTGSFNWTIPVGVATASGTYKIRVRSATTPAITDTSPGFTLTLVPIVVTQPNTLVSWAAGTTQTIKWTTKAPGNVRVDLIDVPGATATVLKVLPASAGSFVWSIPANLTQGVARYKIKVSALNGSTPNASVFGQSAVAFTVGAASVSVSQPNNSAPWVAGTSKKITWSSPMAGNVKIELTDTGGGFITSIKSSVPGSTGSFNWEIPVNVVTASGLYQVKVTTITSPAVAAASVNFQLDLPTITVNDAAAAPWGAGTAHNITWSTTLTSGTVKLEYVTNPGNVATVIKTGVLAKAGTYAWTLPPALAAGNYTIRITSTTNTNIVDSNNVFAISVPSITVPDPANVTAGTGTTSITWTTTVTSAIKIDLLDSSGGFVKNLKASQAASPGAFSWAVPLNAVTASGTYKIKVTSLANGAVTGTSPSGFTITVPSITITAPIGGATIAAGAATVSWTGLTVGNVKIELLSVGNAVLSTLKASVAASANTAAVTLPALTPATGYKIRITSLTNSSITDVITVTS